MCKKIIILGIICMLFTTLNVYADTSSKITMNLSDTPVTVGETVEIVLSAECTGGIEGINSTLKYDETKLKLINEEEIATADFINMSGKDEATGDYKVTVLYAGEESAPTSADFAKLTFEILDAANKSKTLSVQLLDIELGNTNDEWFEAENQEVTLTVEKNDSSQDSNGVIRYVLIIIVAIVLVAIVSRNKRKKR